MFQFIIRRDRVDVIYTDKVVREDDAASIINYLRDKAEESAMKLQRLRIRTVKKYDIAHVKFRCKSIVGVPVDGRMEVA